MVALLVLVAALALPSTAMADRSTFGSDLEAPANAVESHAVDTVYWGPPAPREGQLRYVTIKGGSIQGRGIPEFRFVVLHPEAGRYRVEQVDPTRRFLRFVTEPGAHTNSKNPDWDLCLHRGDQLGVHKVGHGDLQIFSDVPGSVTNWYENAAGLFEGDVFSASSTPDRELLMRVLVMTGEDASDRCPGGYREHVFRGLDFRFPRIARLRSSERSVGVRVRCASITYGGCFGTLTLTARIGGRQRTIGSRSFRFESGDGGSLSVPLSALGAGTIAQRGSLKSTAVVRAHDDPSDPRNRRAPGRRPGTQSGTFEQPLKLKAP